MNKKYLIILPVILVIYSISWEARFKFYEACLKEAKVEIKEKVSADGFFDAAKKCPSCYSPIIEGGYKFVEICIDEDKTYGVILERGCWRFYREPINSPLCREDISKYTQHRISESGESYCIAANKIVAPTARFESGVLSQEIYRSSDRKEAIYKHSWEIRDRENNSLIASQTDFDLIIHYPISGALNTPCSSIRNFKVNHKFWRAVIKPQ